MKVNSNFTKVLFPFSKVRTYLYTVRFCVVRCQKCPEERCVITCSTLEVKLKYLFSTYVGGSGKVQKQSFLPGGGGGGGCGKFCE